MAFPGGVQRNAGGPHLWWRPGMLLLSQYLEILWMLDQYLDIFLSKAFHIFFNFLFSFFIRVLTIFNLFLNYFE